MSHASRPGVGGVLVALASALVALVGVAMVWLALTGGLGAVLERLGVGSPGAREADPRQAGPSPAEPAYAGYSWSQLSKISEEVSAAGSYDQAIAVAASYGLVGEDGTIVDQPHELVLSDDTLAYVRLVGVYHDVRPDGGMAGLTFMAYVCAERPMSEDASCEGGWEASGLRSWLATEGAALLPEELVSVVVPVSKLSNNVGETGDPSSVTPTTDTLWLLSMREVCGDIGSFSREYGSYLGYGAYDDVLNAEGEQYAYFAQQGVTDSFDPNDMLALTYRTASRAWWYRTVYPLDYTGAVEDCFYQVSATGYPSSVGVVDTSSGVVIGFCI